MNNFIFHAPTKIIFGKDTEDKTGDIAKDYGKKALIVYGKGSVIKSGLLNRVKESLTKADMEFEEFGGARPNPTLEHAREGVAIALSINADMIIAVGGGSVIDTSKAIAHGSANPELDIWDIWTKKAEIHKSLPIGAVLTIPAAGSEMSDSAVLTNEDTKKKVGLNSQLNRCAFAIMDPALGMTLPKYQLAAGITDIMMHTMERYFIPDVKCDLTDRIAEGLLTTVIENGMAVMKDQNDYDSMAEIFWASSLSHNNLTECGRSKDFSVHKLGHPLSARFGVTHGASLASVWKAWAEALYPDCPKRFAQYARNIWGVRDNNDINASVEGIKRTIRFFSFLKMPVSLSELDIDISDEDIRQMALDATMNDTLRLSKIRPLDAKEVEKIYRNAL